jgi:thiol-disulfide isomerase/thioredoxin
MKKGVSIGVGVIALLALMVWADRKFPVAGKAAGASTKSSASNDGTLPKIAIKDVEDKDVSLEQYKGQVVLVNFWATWCEPCKIEIPWMIEFQNKYKDRGFTILGLSMDDEGKKVVAPFLQTERFDVNGQKEAVNYPILLANDSIAEQFGGLIGLPTSMLFTREGKKIKTIVGLVNHDDIEKAITSLL